ncbi:hypothetical protein C8Q78DRAFT_1081163 [Trametes maxima]|nr:hypothetical protein C8Q78DRAFT_1081163 [Trametes maxima]
MSTSTPFDGSTPFEPEPSDSSTQRSLTRTSSVRSLFEGRLDGLTPSHDTATQPHTPGPSASSPTLLGDQSFDAAFLGCSWATSTPTPGQRIAPGGSDDLGLALGSARGSTSNTSGARNPANLDTYRQLAEGLGLPSNQADEAVKLATMTPTTARVYLYAQMQTGFSLMNRLLREQQNMARRADSNWTMNKRTKERMHALVRIALLTPLPASWKLDLQRTIMRLLITQGYLSKDLENYEDRMQHVLAATGKYASQIRHDMKGQIETSMKTPYINILDLTAKIAGPCKAEFPITRNILAGMAYLRGIYELEAEERNMDSLGDDAWNLLDVKVQQTRELYKTSEARANHLAQWLKADEDKYRVVPHNATMTRSLTTVQEAVFAATQD